MLMLQILGCIFALLLGAAALKIFNDHCIKKFNYHFFTWHSFIITAVAVLLLLFGSDWYDRAVTENGDTLNGIILGGLGVIAVIGLVGYNFAHTNFGYGFAGSIIQLAVFGTLACISIPVLAIAIFGSTGATRNTGTLGRRVSVNHNRRF